MSVLVTVDANSQILGHSSGFDGLDANILQLLAESLEIGVLVELST